MKYLVYGGGTIGTTYAWLLSQKHEVDILVRPERSEQAPKEVMIHVKDLRKQSKEYEKIFYFPKRITEMRTQYDGVLVCVNRYELKDILPILAKSQHLASYFAFLQNNWDLKREIEAFLPREKTMVAFPSGVGGGRSEDGLEVIVFDEATRLGGECQMGMNDLSQSLEEVGIKTHYDKHIYDWLKLHYLQQSITAGVVLEKGDFLSFAQDDQAIKKMIQAFREGIEVCRLQGVPVHKIFPANLFKLPLFLLARVMKKMFLDNNTIEMVNNHMKKGLPEWIVGYQEVLEDGLKMGLPMTVWSSYKIFVDRYLQSE